MIFIYVLVAVYFIAINLYAFILVKGQKEEAEITEIEKGGESRLLITSLLGGGLAVYAGMLAYRFRVRNLLLMVCVPLLIAVHIMLFFLLLRAGIAGRII